MKFSDIVWSPKLTKTGKLIEGVQKRATKLITELRKILYEERLWRIKLLSHGVCGDMIEV